MPRSASQFVLLFVLLMPHGALSQEPRPWDENAGRRPASVGHAAAEAAVPRKPLLLQASHREAADVDLDQPSSSQLGPRGLERPRRPSPDGEPETSGRKGSAAVAATLASLGVVLGLFFLVMWVLRRHLPSGSLQLPSDVLEVLGRGTIGAKQGVHLVRLGDRLLLVANNGQSLETLAEITDPDEVTRLAGLCRQAHPQSATAAFRDVFQKVTGPPPRAAKAEVRRG